MTDTLTATKVDALDTLLKLAGAMPGEAAIRCHRIPGKTYQMHYVANEAARPLLESIGVKLNTGVQAKHGYTSEKFPLSVSRESINEALGKEGDLFYVAVREPEKTARVVGA